MKPFRKNLAVAIDGGGIRGIIVTTALTMLEKELGYPLHERVGLLAGTSTGSIIATSIALGLEAKTVNDMYKELGDQIFRKSLRSMLWFLFNHRYSAGTLEQHLRKYFGDCKVADLWEAPHPIDLVLTTFDVVENRTRFIKPYKSKYRQWPLVKAVRASSAAPTYFPSVDGQFIDGGVGSYNNPCYLAAYEILFHLKWKREETTLLSFGTGRDPNGIAKGEPDNLLPIQYISPMLNAFSNSANDQQVDLVSKLFEKLDFRRYQVDLKRQIPLDDISDLKELERLGTDMGHMVLGDKIDRAARIIGDPIPKPKGSTSRRQKNKNDSPPPPQRRTSAKPSRAPQKR